MERIVCHWTAGDYVASLSDRSHYHILIEGDGRLVRGDFSIADNVPPLHTGPARYAAHTRGTNSRCIGVSVCCMGAGDGPEVTPANLGPMPMLRGQWLRMAEVVAQLCRRYAIPVTPQTVLGHGEVEPILGTPQAGKWDPLVLPWAPEVPMEEAGERFRQAVRAALAGPAYSGSMSPPA